MKDKKFWQPTVKQLKGTIRFLPHKNTEKQPVFMMIHSSPIDRKAYKFYGTINKPCPICEILKGGTK